MQDNLLGGIYDDLFGVGRLVTPSTLPNEGKTKEEQEAIANARSALEEAKSMVNLIDKEKENLQNKNAEALKTATASVAPEKPEEPETDPMEDLDALIGLTAIKDDVKELIAFVKIQKMRKEQGLKAVPVSLHLVFTGNPGTGKTTVARILARLYKQIGVLSKGQLVEVDRSGLVAGYVGQTAIKTQCAFYRRSICAFPKRRRLWTGSH